ncbi:VF530 family protein [Candidatus Gracilibacteria bacterium]|nr:VF530 family protein [Candidatus Gracilibacteria bacterium]
MQNNHEILHGVSLKTILDKLLEQYGFDGLDSRLKMNCFGNNPSIKSSLTFLRKTPWAREKVESLYVDLITEME